ADLGTSITAGEIADGDHGFFSYASGVASLDTGGLTSANLAASLTNESGGTGVFPLFSLTSQTYGDLTLWDGTNWVNIATSTLGVALSDTTGTLSIAKGGTNATSQTTNGVNYFNGTSITSGTGLTFDGTNLGVASTSPWAKLAVNPVAGDTNQFVVGSSTATSFIINSAGNVGIGTTSPARKLEIAGSNTNALRLLGTNFNEVADFYVGSTGFLVLDLTASSDTTPFFDFRPADDQYGLVIRDSSGAGTSPFSNFYVTNDTVDYLNIVVNATTATVGLVISDADHVGVGTTTPWKTLSVTETVADAQLALAYDTTRYATFQVTSVGDLVIDAQGADVSLLDENLYICTGGSCPTAPSGTGNLLVENIFVAPQGTAPTVTSAGAIAVDTSGDDMLLVADEGGTARAIPLLQKIWSVTVASTSPAFIAASTLPVPVQLDGYTINDIRCKVDGGTSKVIAVEDASANATEDITCAATVTSDDGTITNATATAAEEMYIDFGATSGAVNYVTITVYGYWTRE
ncbi:MAG: hypothetical protein AAB439_04165, partial [Patescibacteria group bacterium]